MNRFALEKNADALLVFFNRVPYMQLSYMISEVNIIGRKVSVASINGDKGSGGSLKSQCSPKKILRNDLASGIA